MDWTAQLWGIIKEYFIKLILERIAKEMIAFFDGKLWALVGFFLLAFLTGGGVIHHYISINGIDAKIDTLNSSINRIDEKLGSIDAKIDEKYGSIDAKIDEKLGSIHLLLEMLNKTLNRTQNDHQSSISALNRTQNDHQRLLIKTHKRILIFSSIIALNRTQNDHRRYIGSLKHHSGTLHVRSGRMEGKMNDEVFRNNCFIDFDS